MLVNPITFTILPLLFVVLIFITYLNVLESKRTKSIDEKLDILTEHLKTIADTVVDKK